MIKNAKFFKRRSTILGSIGILMVGYCIYHSIAPPTMMKATSPDGRLTCYITQPNLNLIGQDLELIYFLRVSDVKTGEMVNVSRTSGGLVAGGGVPRELIWSNTGRNFIYIYEEEPGSDFQAFDVKVSPLKVENYNPHKRNSLWIKDILRDRMKTGNPEVKDETEDFLRRIDR